MQFLSKSTIEILKKYKDVEPFEHINGVDICSVEQSDLSFMLGYISASMRIEEKLNKKIERYEEVLKEIADEFAFEDIYDEVNTKRFIAKQALSQK